MSVGSLEDFRRRVQEKAKADGHLPAEFWEARAELAHIRQAAYSRTRSPDLVLHAVLARVAGIVPHTLLLPATVGSPRPLSYFAALVGPPGSGKSSGHGVAKGLVPAPEYVVDSLPVGSGEGLAEVLFDLVPEEDDNGRVRQVKRQVHNNAIVYVDEGEALGALGRRQGSTLLPTLRSIWSGETIGQTNASTERKRIVPAGSYTFGVMVALQSGKAGDLLADAAAGTPQRFGWAWATDPAIPSERIEWPGALAWTPPASISGREFAIDAATVAEVREHELAIQRGELVIATADAHGMLLRLKVAGLLAVLAGRTNIDTEDWQLAELVVRTSKAVRLKVEGIVADEAARNAERVTQAIASRQVAVAVAVSDGEVERVAKRIVAVVGEVDHTEGIAYGPITAKLSRRQRDVAEEALGLALDNGWIVRRVSPGQGPDKERFFVA